MAKTGFQPDGMEEATTASEALSINSLKVQKLQLQDFVQRLPIGIWANGERLQTLEFNEYTTEHDLILTRKSREDLSATLGRFLPEIVKTINGYTLKEIAQMTGDGTPRKLIERMYLADALTIVLNLRLATVGADIAIADKCPRCTAKVEDGPEVGYHDIGTVEMGIVPHLQAKPVFEVKLEKGFNMVDTTVTTIHVQPFRLFQMNNLKGVPDKQVLRHMMYNMVSALPEVIEYQGMTSGLFTDGEYAALGHNLADRDILVAATEQLMSIGPRMAIKLACDQCEHEWNNMLPWQDIDNFLSQSATTAARRLQL